MRQPLLLLLAMALSRGSLLRAMLLSAGMAAAGWGGAAPADDAPWLLLIPPARIAGATLVERASAYRALRDGP